MKSDCTWGSSSVVNHVTCSTPVLSSILYVHACHSRGALPAHWACRILSGPWRIVVVRVNWPEHPMIIKKKMESDFWDANKYVLNILMWIIFHSSSRNMPTHPFSLVIRVPWNPDPRPSNPTWPRLDPIQIIDMEVPSRPKGPVIVHVIRRPRVHSFG